jgi:dihydropteroate synthase
VLRLIELLAGTDAVEACAAAGRAPDANLRGWGALVPLQPRAFLEALRQAGLRVLQGDRAALATGTLSQILAAARDAGASLEGPGGAAARELQARAEAIDARPQWEVAGAHLPARTWIMGIVNVTPDSFSDGGRYLDKDAAVEHGCALVAQGADLLDVGGESTRPGAEAVGAREERARTEPVVRELARRTGVPVSIDTSKADVAQAALEAGARIVNDVSALARDPAMAAVVARSGAAVVLMHMRGTPAEMQERATYRDLLGEVHDELALALERARGAGIPQARIAVDPGLGFAKRAEHNLLLLRRLRELKQLGRPLLVGASRKSFLGKLTGRPAPERAGASVAAAAVAALNGAAAVRVHDVAETREALAVCDAVLGASALSDGERT